MSYDELLAYIRKIETKPIRHEGRGRPHVPLLTDEGMRKEMMICIEKVADLLYLPRIGRFRIINKVRVHEEIIGKSFFWGLMYEVLCDEGYIRKGNNIASFRHLLKTDLNDTSMLCPREKIGDIVREWNAFQLMDTGEDKSFHSETTRLKCAKFMLYYKEIKDIFENYSQK